ncbi:LysM peptidoglycan-binding domain-containing protein [Phyllobacterium sp. SB3]|uniref:LysM peptidoglycan-binding domain-containing protein n=1 Tax=Phyllobacterium sp. SB3 TaxID=3156073 RepID=UPI0032AE9B64
MFGPAIAGEFRALSRGKPFRIRQERAMSFRIDIDGKSRYDANGNKIPLTSLQQQKLFVEQISEAVRERAKAGGPSSFDPDKEKLIVVQPGDNLWEIAKDNNVRFGDVIEANKGLHDNQIDLVESDDVIIIPHIAPDLAASTPKDSKGVPGGEAAFKNELYERGNNLQYVDDPSKTDFSGETKNIQGDVGAYLDSLPAGERQAAVSRLIGNKSDWQDARPALTAIETAATERQLIADPQEAFANDIYTTGNKLQYSDNPDTDYKAGTAGIASDVKTYLQGIPEGERAKSLQALYDHDWADAGPSQIALENTAKELGISLRPSTHRGPEIESQARLIIDNANAAGKPEEAFKSLNASYSKAPAELQEAIRGNADAKELIGKTADWATERLKDYDPEKATSDQGDSAESMRKLEALTKDADPQLAAQLMLDALPTIEAANARRQEKIGGDLIGREGQQNLTTILGRIGETPTGQTVIDRFTKMDTGNPESMRMAIISGSGLDFPLARAATTAGSSTYLESTILPSVVEFSKGSVNGSVDQYSTHMQELQWLISNHGATMTPEQLEKAIADYETEKGQGWKDQKLALENDVAAKGNQLLNQLSQLGSLPPELASQQGKVDEKIKEILSDDKSVMAMQVALKNDPALLDKPAVVSLLSQQARLTDRGRKLAEEAMTQIVRRTVLPSFGNLNPNDPASIERAKAGITSLQNSPAAKLLGIPDDEFKKALKAVEESLPAAGDTEVDMVQKLKNLDAKLTDTNDGMKSFKNTTVPGQMLRLIGLAAVGVGLASTLSKTGQGPLMKFKVFIDAAGVAQRSIELLNGFQQINPDSLAVKHFGSSSTTAAKWLGSVGASFDLVLATRSYTGGDWQMGTLQAAAGVGGIIAAFGTGSMAGPVGLVIVGAAVIGQMLLTNTRESNIYMTDTSMRFLQHSQLSQETSKALVDQSGEGFSPVPLLMKYAEMKGYKLDQPADLQRFVSWLNAIPQDKLATLRDNLHHTLDGLNGDISGFPATAGNDANYTDPQKLHHRTQSVSGKAAVSLPSLADKINSGDASPQSITQVDAMIRELGLPLA